MQEEPLGLRFLYPDQDIDHPASHNNTRGQKTRYDPRPEKEAEKDDIVEVPEKDLRRIINVPRNVCHGFVLLLKIKTLQQLTPIVRRVRNRAIKQYWSKKCREVSLYKPVGRNAGEALTLESELKSATTGNAEENDNSDNGLYSKMVAFLLGEYSR